MEGYEEEITSQIGDYSSSLRDSLAVGLSLPSSGKFKSYKNRHCRVLQMTRLVFARIHSLRLPPAQTCSRGDYDTFFVKVPRLFLPLWQREYSNKSRDRIQLATPTKHNRTSHQFKVNSIFNDDHIESTQCTSN